LDTFQLHGVDRTEQPRVEGAEATVKVTNWTAERQTSGMPTARGSFSPSWFPTGSDLLCRLDVFPVSLSLRTVEEMLAARY
jgi:hypothetical protein